jgi:hypothetical protein
MKTCTIGIVSAAFLMVVAGVGFGIAQAAGNQSYDLALSFGDQDVNPYVGQASEAVETGGLPDRINEDASIVGTEGHNYLGGEDIDDGAKRD